MTCQDNHCVLGFKRLNEGESYGVYACNYCHANTRFEADIEGCAFCTVCTNYKNG